MTGHCAWRRQSLSYFIFRLADRLVPLLPQGWLAALATVLGSAAYGVAGNVRLTAVHNLQPVVGRPRADTVRRMFVHNAQYYVSLFVRRPAHFDLNEHALHGWEHFAEALALGRGCILASPHLGDINYYAELFVASGLPVNVLVEELQPARLSRLVAALRARRGVHVIVGGRGALREVYRALDRNEIVGLISDRSVDGSGVPVCFFGQQVTMPDIAMVIGARRRTPVVVGAAVRQDDGRIVADIRPYVIPGADSAAETQRMAGVFEEFIRRWPDQWLAFQPILGRAGG